jgi:hypothetical protein
LARPDGSYATVPSFSGAIALSLSPLFKLSTTRVALTDVSVSPVAGPAGAPLPFVEGLSLTLVEELSVSLLLLKLLLFFFFFFFRMPRLVPSYLNVHVYACVTRSEHRCKCNGIGGIEHMEGEDNLRVSMRWCCHTTSTTTTFAGGEGRRVRRNPRFFPHCQGHSP